MDFAKLKIFDDDSSVRFDDFSAQFDDLWPVTYKVVGRQCKCQKVGYARVSNVSAEKVKDICLKG